MIKRDGLTFCLFSSFWSVILLTGPKPTEQAKKVTRPQEDNGALEDFPTLAVITSIEDNTAKLWNDIWDMTQKMSVEDRLNHSYIDMTYWPKMLAILQATTIPISNMDEKILFKRKPSALMDALFRISSLKHVWNRVTSSSKSEVDLLTIKFFELSSAASQMHRFYRKRMRDILKFKLIFKRDEPRIGAVARSIFNYKTFHWRATENGSAFRLTPYRDTVGITTDKLLYLDGKKDVFQGIREILGSNPDIVMQAQFDGKVCEGNETMFTIEPVGLDIPYYVLFHLCLVDIKFFSLMNFAYLYNQVYLGLEFTNQTGLREEMRASVQNKITLFDNAFKQFLVNTGPTYNTYPGVANCDPKNWTYEDSYFKLTNFIKVFVAPEQELHKAGNCKQTCDVLDGTYKPCSETDLDCRIDDELDCLTRKDRCVNFNPPCPPGQYQCQNATSRMTACPSQRFDRMYEYIKGNEYYFGKPDHECANQTISYTGGWRMEQDTLVDTPHFCEICSCYCFEPLVSTLGNHSVRIVNEYIAKSKFLLNYVVVGVKFEKVDDQFSIRIAEAKAISNRKVDMSTLEWGPIVYETRPAHKSRLNKDLRSVNLDDVVVDQPDRVVTGVKLYQAHYQGHVRYHYMGLAILTHRITENGTILADTGKLRKNGNSTAHRNRFSYAPDPDGPDDPILANGPSLPDTTSNQYSVFVGTSLEKDAAQSTIPYFDSQKLIRPEPRPLKGLGIFHKSRPGFGGFLSLKLIEHYD